MDPSVRTERPETDAPATDDSSTERPATTVTTGRSEGSDPTAVPDGGDAPDGAEAGSGVEIRGFGVAAAVAAIALAGMLRRWENRGPF
jgi:hypothetical protein